jgi:hypothetical protein
MRAGSVVEDVVTTAFARLLLWSPRILGIGVSLFIALFALDAFSQEKTFIQALPDFLIHLTPTLLLLAIVVAAWRWAWLGGVTFIALALAYAIMVRWRLDWVAVISGPLLVVGLLFLGSWLSRRDLHAA